MRQLLRVSLLLLGLAATGCRLTSGPARILRSEPPERIDVDTACAELADYDVVFLGEEHDNDAAHRLQLALFEGLHPAHPEIALSLEMFERDVQTSLDLYLRGGIGEPELLANARPWPNYREHYRPAVEYSRAHGLPVLAANCPRPMAGRVAREGLDAVLGDPWCALHVDASEGPYREAFLEAMGDHGSGPGMDVERWYQAQCLKDDTMAESIAGFLAAHASRPPLVVHWCGKFHSDRGLGTVERLLRRRPDLKVAVVSTISGGSLGRELDPEERASAAYVLRVPRP